MSVTESERIISTLAGVMHFRDADDSLDMCPIVRLLSGSPALATPGSLHVIVSPFGRCLALTRYLLGGSACVHSTSLGLHSAVTFRRCFPLTRDWLGGSA